MVTLVRKREGRLHHMDVPSVTWRKYVRKGMVWFRAYSEETTITLRQCGTGDWRWVLKFHGTLGGRKFPTMATRGTIEDRGIRSMKYRINMILRRFILGIQHHAIAGCYFNNLRSTYSREDIQDYVATIDKHIKIHEDMLKHKESRHGRT